LRFFVLLRTKVTADANACRTVAFGFGVDYIKMPPMLAIIEAKMRATVLITLMSGLIEGPAVSL
jgi:hypothetical protein